MPATLKRSFLRSSEAWLCDDYTFDLRYICQKDNSGFKILDAKLFLNPLPPQEDFNLQLEVGDFLVGQILRTDQKRADLIALLQEIVLGSISITTPPITLSSPPEKYTSDFTNRGRWLSPLHLEIHGSPAVTATPEQLASCDDRLRMAKPPFDGLTDVLNWLGLRSPENAAESPRVTVQINPPVEVSFSDSKLENDSFQLTLHAHPNFDLTKISASLVMAPSKNLDFRLQISHKLSWGNVSNGVRVGLTNLSLRNAYSALVMLLIGDTTVQRQWFHDANKFTNIRLSATQFFDQELRVLRRSLLEPTGNSDKFEKAICSLLFLFGFNPATQVEADAPDLIVMTPQGRLAIVECTIRTSDLISKVGKLVNRKIALSKQMDTSGHSPEVHAFLVCSLPRDEMLEQAELFRTQNVGLVTREDIESFLLGVRYPKSPDLILDTIMSHVDGKSQ